MTPMDRADACHTAATAILATVADLPADAAAVDELVLLRDAADLLDRLADRALLDLRGGDAGTGTRPALSASPPGWPSPEGADA